METRSVLSNASSEPYLPHDAEHALLNSLKSITEKDWQRGKQRLKSLQDQDLMWCAVQDSYLCPLRIVALRTVQLG